MGSALREDGVVAALDDWETYLLHQTEIVGELVKQLGDFAESNSAVLLGGETMEKNIVPGSGAYMVSGRPKTIISLKEKLRRMPKTPLERIHDVAGARLDCDVTLTQQRRIADELCDLFTKCGATRVDIKDLRDGSHSGYRAIHLHLRFPAGFAEVQVRTALQSHWANVYESAADIFGRHIRYLHEENQVPLSLAARKAVKVKLLHDLSAHISQVEEKRDECSSVHSRDDLDYDMKHRQEIISELESNIQFILNLLDEEFRKVRASRRK
jgi:uncharacterized protein rv1366/MT1412